MKRKEKETVHQIRQQIQNLFLRSNQSEVCFLFKTVHRGAFFQYSFRWSYYYGSNKSTGKETGKSHLFAEIGGDIRPLCLA